MSYGNEMQAKAVAYGQIERGLVDRVDHNPTVGENIDMRIKQMQAEIARLEESKITLGPLLPMRISDIRSAMNY